MLQIKYHLDPITYLFLEVLHKKRNIFVKSIRPLLRSEFEKKNRYYQYCGKMFSLDPNKFTVPDAGYIMTDIISPIILHIVVC